MEQPSDVPRMGRQYTGIFADGHARQHNGDTIMNGYINYITVTDSVVHVTESSSMASRQDTPLQTRSAHKSLETTKKDTASMIVHRDDGSSIQSHFTDGCSKLSLEFAFDWQLWSTVVYEKKWRSLFKRDIAKGRTGTKQPSSDCIQSTTGAADSVTALEQHLVGRQQRSRDIDRMLRKDSKTPWIGKHALLLGTSYEDRAMVISRLQALHGDVYTPVDSAHYKLLLYKDLVYHTKMLVNFVSEYDVKLGDRVDQGKLLEVLSYDFSADSHVLFAKELAMAVVALWEDPSIPTALARGINRHVPDSALQYVTALILPSPNA
jgi:hypothetical protein